MKTSIRWGAVILFAGVLLLIGGRGVLSQTTTHDQGSDLPESDSELATILAMDFEGPDGGHVFNDQTERHRLTAVGDAHVDRGEAAQGRSSGLFDGNGDYLMIPDSHDWDFGSDDFVIDFWTKPNASGVQQHFLNQGTPREHALGFRLDPDNKLYFLSQTEAGGILAYYITTDAVPIFDDEWHHIEVIRTGTEITIRIDGKEQVLYEQVPIGKNALANGTTPVTIGSRIDGTFSYNGWIDEFKIQKAGVIAPTHAKLVLSGEGEDGSQAFIDTAGDHSVTPVGNVQIDTSASAKGLGSILFDGSGDYLTIPDSEDWNLGTDDFTMDFRVRFNGANPNVTLISQTQNGAQAHYMQFMKNGDLLRFQFYDLAGNLVFGFMNPWVPVPDRWYNVALVREGKTWQMFVDDQPLGAPVTSASSIPDYAGPLVIGSLVQEGYVSNPLNGWMDEVMIQKIEKPIPTDTRLYAPFDGADGSQNFVDVVGRHTITPQGNVQMDASESISGGASAQFANQGDYLTTPDSPDLNFSTKDFTFDFYTKFSSHLNTADVWAQKSDDGAFMKIYFPNDGRIGFQVRKDEVDLANYYTANFNDILENQWQHVQIMRRGTEFSMFLDGKPLELVISKAIGTSAIPDLTGDVYIGRSWNDIYQFYGWVDEFTVRISDPSVTPEQRLMITGEGPDGSQVIPDESGRHPTIPIGDVHIDQDLSYRGVGSVRFDGSGDALELPDHADWAFGTKDFTFDFVVRFDELTTYAPIYDQRTDDQNYVYLYKNTINGINFESMSNGVMLGNFYTDPNTVTADRWHRITVQRIKGEEKIIIDGVDKHLNYDSPQNNPDAQTSYPDLAAPVMLGWRNSALWYVNGWLDDFELTVEEPHVREAPSTLPLAHYDFNETTGRAFYDEVNWYNAWIQNPELDVNTLSIGDGVEGRAIHMEPTLPNDSFLNTDRLGTVIQDDTKGTVSFWVKKPESGTVMSMYKEGEGTYTFGADPSGVDFLINGIYEQRLQDVLHVSWTKENVFADEKWHHIAWVQDGEEIALYIDGVQKPVTKEVALDPGAWFGTIEKTFKYMFVGGRVDNDRAFSEPYIGDLDELAYFSKPLSAEEVRTLYEETPDVSESEEMFNGTKLLLHYNGSDGQTNTEDASSREQLAQFIGGANLSRDDKQFGISSLALNGNDSYVRLPNDAAWDVVKSTEETWTIESWVRHTGPYVDDFDEIYVGQFETVGQNEWYLRHERYGGLTFRIIQDGTITFTLQGGLIDDEAWHHVAVIKKGTAYALYIDGEQTATAESSVTADFTGDLTIGAKPLPPIGQDHFEGYLDELRIVKGNPYQDNPNTLPLSLKPLADIEFATTSLLFHANDNNRLHKMHDERGHILNPAGDAHLDQADRKLGNASLALDGDGDYVKSVESKDWDIVNSDAFSIGLWVRHGDLPSRQETYLGQFQDDQNYWAFYREPSGLLRFRVVKNGAAIVDLAGAGAPNRQWQYLNIVKQGQEYGLYSFGQQIGYAQDADGADFSGPLIIGSKNGEEDFFKGHMDEVLVTKGNVWGVLPQSDLTTTMDPPVEEFFLREATEGNGSFIHTLKALFTIE